MKRVCLLGKQGFVEGLPGNKVYPPQPMVSQMRYVLEQYRDNGEEYEEYIIANAGHSPHIENQMSFMIK